MSEGKENERKPASRSDKNKQRWTAADKEARKEQHRGKCRERNKPARREKAKRKKEKEATPRSSTGNLTATASSSTAAPDISGIRWA